MANRSRRLAALSLAAWCALAACGDDSEPIPEPLQITQGCNPLMSELDCLLPYPSDFFRVETSAGPRVVLEESAMPRFEEVPTDVLALHRPDGFSVGTPIIAAFGTAIDDAALVFWTDDDVERSRSGDSPTWIVDAESGERVLHFAELDPRATGPERQGLILRPLERLAAGRRYIVAIRALQRPDGSAIEAPAGFASLRDDAGRAHPTLEAASPHYEADVFPILEAAGAPRSELILAWDFTTRSDEDAAGDLLAIREDMLSRFAAGPTEVSLVEVEQDVSEHIALRIELTLRVPLYVSSTEPGAVLNGEPGAPEADGFADVPVTVWIPPSVAERAPGTPPARLLQYSHGFFGTRYEADDFPAQLADEEGFVIVAADWWGLSDEDSSFVVGQLVSDPANTLLFTDRLHQAFANFLALGDAALGPIAELPELQIGGEPAYDASALYFYGISLGHILGQTYVALSPEIERAALGVGGADFSMMLFRARPFLPFLAFLQAQMSDPLDQQKFAALAQSNFDRIDPHSYGPYLLSDPLPGAPSKRVLLQLGVADSEVPNLASYFNAAMLGVPLLEEASPDFPSWLGRTSAPSSESALTVFDFGIEPTVTAINAPEPTPVHDGLRRLEASKRQVSEFLKPDGVIIQPCRGACDPE